MRRSNSFSMRLSRTLRVASVTLVAAMAGCGAGGSPYSLFGSPFTNYVGRTGSGGNGTGIQIGGGNQLGSRDDSDPCTLDDARKFVSVSMRNYSTDYVHYFVVFIAFVRGDVYTDGAVCADDEALYLRNGYTKVNAGSQVTFGSYCLIGPALYRYHLNGAFSDASNGGGTTRLASAIPPGTGSAPTYDAFFTSSGARLPVPNAILFHNPGTGAGRSLKISVSDPAPCATTSVGTFDPLCDQDSFYYVDDSDRLVGSVGLGTGSGRRVASEVQGTGCECGGTSEAFAILAPSEAPASSALCNEFFRGGRIDFAFVRKDEDPPFPQLVWRVTDANGSLAHDFDARSGVR